MEDSFKLHMYALGGKGDIWFNVEVYYRSEQVIRFQLYAGEKEMKLEKQLLKKQNSWKLLDTNFAFETVDESTTRNLFEIFHLLDEEITNKSRVTYRNPSERGSNK